MARKRVTTQPATSGRRRLAAAASAIPLAIGLASGGLPSSTHVNAFTPVCSLPFAGLRNPPIDDRCAIQGGSTNPAKQAESQSKNNFCSATHAPEAFNYQDFLNLQSKATTANLGASIQDRTILENMGEGKYVTYVAFVKDAHYSDTNAGEAVNCNIPGDTTNDIHIVLMPDPTDNNECHSTTAEMSPHYRPASWTPDNITKASAGHPVRVQGHLFYDGSHSPCTPTSSPNPKRASLWEIHPVYSLEVCNLSTIAECNSSNAEWTALDQVFASEPSQ